MAALLGLCQPGDLVLLPRHGHRCLVSAAVVSGIRPAFLRGEVDRAWGLPLGVTGQEVEEALNRFPETKAVVLVYPTYEGVSPDLARAVEAAHRRGVKVVVDAAHGAHFGFHPQFPPRALAVGADVVVDGWHKTLGSLTQTAVLHLREESESLSRVAWALDLLQTTSPSYVLLSSLEALCLQLAERGGELWEGALAAAGEVRSWVRAQSGLTLWEPGPGWLQDPLRVVVSARDYGYDGAELASMLREHGGVVVEAWGAHHVLMVLSFADGPECVPAIIRALQRIEPKPGPAKTEDEVFLKGIALPRAPLTPREAFFAPQRLVPLSQASGKIAARPIVPYPPGIPICWPGEVVEEDVVDYVTALVARGGQVQGLTPDMKVAVVAE
jgi:arginine/lysine/ornithine decarboxylase